MVIKLPERTVQSFAVLALILTSGAGIINSIYLLIFSTLLLFIIGRKKFSKKIAFYVLVFTAFLLINTVFGRGGDVSSHEIFLLLTRAICVLVIFSNMSFKDFILKYLNIMELLCIASLFFWILIIIFPGIMLSISFVYDGLRGNLFQVYGFANNQSFIRNCGVFWEPGIYMIYLNFAIMLTVFNYSTEFVERKKRKLVLFIVTLLSTMSTMGYICFAITMLATVFVNFNQKRSSKFYIQFFSCLSILVLLVFESRYQVFTYKFSHASSFDSRIQDFFAGIVVAKNNPIIGIGLARDYTTVLARAQEMVRNRSQYYGALANSNGLVSSLYKAGIPFTCFYFIKIWKVFKKMSPKSLAVPIIFLINILLFFMNESIMYTPFWLVFLLIPCNKVKEIS